MYENHGTPVVSRVQSRGGIHGALFGGGGGSYGRESFPASIARLVPSESDSFAWPEPDASRVSAPLPPIIRTFGPWCPPVTFTVSFPSYV